MKKPLITPTIFLSAAAMALPLAAQTTTSAAKSAGSTTTTHSSSVATHETPCARPAPHQPQNIPALPAGTPCAKALYTLRTTSPTHLVYASPLLSDGVRDALTNSTMTFSLDYVDTVVGTGAKVEAGKYLSVRYSGYLSLADAKPGSPESKQDGTKFDSTDDHPGKEPFPIQYGMHSVIEGWDTGFEGMRVGGKRRLYIPWQLAYGERGRPPRIPAKADLIFDVEVVSQSDTAPAPPARPMPMTPHPGAPGAAVPPHATTVTPQPPQATAPGSTAAPQSGSTTTAQPNKPQ
jgi:peptidylprolyl isomerase